MVTGRAGARAERGVRKKGVPPRVEENPVEASESGGRAFVGPGEKTVRERQLKPPKAINHGVKGAARAASKRSLFFSPGLRMRLKSPKASQGREIETATASRSSTKACV